MEKIDAIKGKIMRLKLLLSEKSQYAKTIENFQYLPLEESDLGAFEKKHQVTLPEDFRDYLLQIGNGGLGPDYGIYPIQSTQSFKGINQSWVDPKAYNAMGEDDFGTPFGQTLIKASRKGILYIGDRGGGFSTFLVITGPNSGEVWYDKTVTDEGFALAADDFLSWYEDWVDRSIEDAKKKMKERNQVIHKVKSTSPTSMPQDVISLNGVIGAFRDQKDVEPLMDFLGNYLKQENLSQNLFESLMDFLLDTSQMVNYPLALKLIAKVADEVYAHDPPFRKKLLCFKGEVLIGLEKYDLGIRCFEQALEIDVDFYPTGLIPDRYAKILGYAHLVQNNVEHALAAMEPFHETHGIAPAVELLGDLREKYARPDLAIAWGKNLLKWETLTNHSNYRHYLVYVYIQLVYSSAKEKDKKLLNSFLEGLQDAHPNPELIPFDSIALQLYNSKLYSIVLDILKRYEGSSRAKNNSSWLYNMMGCCYEGLKMYSESKIYFKRSFETNRWIVPYSNLIRIHIFLGQPEMAKQIFEEVISFDPYYSWSYYQFSLYHIKTKEHDKAVTLLLKAVSLGFDTDVIENDPELGAVLEQFKTTRV